MTPYRLPLTATLLTILCVTSAVATERELPISRIEFQQQFNEAARRNNVNLTATETRFRDPWCTFEVAKGLEIGGFVHHSDGNLRDLDVTLRLNQNPDYNRFLAAVNCVIDVVDPSIGRGKADLIAQLGLAKRPGPEVKRAIERNGFEYEARTYDEGQRIYFSVDQSYDAYRAASSSGRSSRRARYTASAVAPRQSQPIVAPSAKGDAFSPADDGENPGTSSVADTASPSDTRISRPESNNTSTSSSSRSCGRSTSNAGNAIGTLLSRASGTNVPGLGSVPYSGAARQALRGLSSGSSRSSRGSSAGTDNSNSGDHHWSADGVRAGNPRDRANYAEFMRRKYWGDQSLRVDPNDPYAPRPAKSAQSPPRQIPAALNENGSTQSAPRQASRQGLAYQNYSIGMTLDEFQRLPLPAGARLEKHRDSQSVTPKVVYNIDGATFDIGPVRWNPTFAFHETPSGYKLTEIRGDIENADIENVASTLASDYGRPKISKQTLYRWDFPNGLMRVCQALGRDVGEVCFEDRNFIAYEANPGGKLVEQRSYAPITTQEDLRSQSNPRAIPPGWHRLSCPAGISPSRWEEIQEYVFQTTLDEDYRPSIGDVCFVSQTEIGWMTPAAKDKYTHAYLKEREGKNDFKQPSQKFYDDTAAQSNGSLIVLNAGTKVRVLDGAWKRAEIAPIRDAKIQVLSGPHTGKTCFSMGMGYGTHPPNPDQFCKTESDKRAIEAVFVSRSLSRNGDVSLTPDELRLHTLLERD